MFEIKIVNNKALKDFIDEINYIKSNKPLQETKNDLRTDLINKIQKNFNKGQEADGTKWKPLKYRQGKPLLLTYKMYNSTRAKNTQNGVKVYNNTKYAAFQNFGTEKVPARRFIPQASEVPQSWINDFKEIVLKNYMRD